MSTLTAQDTKSRQGAIVVPGLKDKNENVITANMITLVGNDGTVSTKPGVQDGGSAFSDTHGVGSPAVPFTSANASGSDAAVTNAPASGKKIVISDLVVSVDTDMTVTFKEETTGTVIAGPFYMAARSTMQVTTRSGALRAYTSDKKITVRTSTTGNISVDCHYHSES